MKCFIYLLVYVHLKLNVEALIFDHGNVQDYLNEELRLLSEKQESRLKRNVNNYHIKLNEYIDNGDSWNFVSPFRLFNDSYLMINKDLHKLFSQNKLNLCDHSFCEPILEVIEEETTITRAEMMEFENYTFMFVVLRDKRIKIVKFESDIHTYQEVQTINNPHISDVKFFLNQGKLNLIVSNQKSTDLSPISLYQWMDDHFDEKTTFFEQGITEIHPIKNKGSQFIIMLQKKRNMTYCIVYEFDNETLKKRQVIQSDGSKTLIPYVFENEQYVLFLGYYKQSIYKWNEFELVKWSSQNIHIDFKKASLFYFNNTSLLFMSSLDKLTSYETTSEGLESMKTITYSNNFTEIINIGYAKEKDSEHLFIIGSIENSSRFLSYNVDVEQMTKSDKLPFEQDPLVHCLADLDTELHPEDFDVPIKKIMSPMVREGAPKSLPSYSMRTRISEITDIEIDDKIAEIKEKYFSVDSVISKLEDDEEKMVINGDMIIEGTLRAKKLIAQNINMKKLNNRQWLPERWLSYSKNQTIPGSIDADILRVKKLITTPEVDVFNGMVLNNTDVKLNGDIKIGNISITRMYVDEINNIEMSDVFLKSRDSIVRGIKTFSQLTAGSVEAINIRNQTAQEVLNKMFKQSHRNTPQFASNVFIEDLEVGSIDDIDWELFKSTVFRHGLTDTITGNLRIKTFQAENLDAKILNNQKVHNLFTNGTNQTINSVFIFQQIYSNNISVNTINGLDFTDSFATVYSPSIKGPVSIEDIHIKGNLILNYTMDNYFTSKDNQHVVGTNESDLFQRYTGQIKIHGNLRVNNLRMQEKSSILLGYDKELFNPQLEEKYWMKNKNQMIPVHVKAQEGITTPHLQIKMLNGIGISNYLLNNTEKAFPASFSFENATFLGNIFLNDEKSHVPNLKKIDSESVKVNGSFLIQGKKTFKDLLKIRILHADSINNLTQDNILTSEKPIIFTGKKIFHKLFIRGDFLTGNHTCQRLNDVDLDEIRKDTVYIDRPQEINSLNFSSIYVESMGVNTLNDRPIGEYIIQVNDTLNSDVIDTLIIKGNLTIGNLLNLSKINEKDPNVLFMNKLKRDGDGVIHGNVRFTDNVTIDNLSASMLNNINLPIFTRRLLYKNGNQSITGKYTFKNLKTVNLVVPVINNISMDPLVDIRSTRPQQLIAPGGIEFREAVLKSLQSNDMSPCNLNKAMEVLKNPPTQYWSKMKIKGNVDIIDQDSDIYDILENVVLFNTKNIIKAPVNFSSMSVQNLQTFQHINDINLTDIFVDALYKEYETEQIVTGQNHFDGLAAFSASVKNNSDIPIVLSMEISKLDRMLIRKDEVNIDTIRGKKIFFAGLETEKIQANTVSNINPNNIVTITDQRVIPSGTFESIQISKDLIVDHLNKQDFNRFLKDRLLISGPPVQEVHAIYLFDNVHIAGNLTTPSINGINISDVVFDVDNQEITSWKNFIHDVNITGNVEITMLNGQMLSEMYQKMLFKNEEGYIKNNVQILGPSVVDGTINTDSINGYSLERMREILDNSNSQHYTEVVHDTIVSIEKSVQKNLRAIEGIPSDIMYIEKSKEIEMAFPSTIQEAKTFRIKDYVLIQIMGYQEGNTCGLLEECRCPVQYTIEISPENSINFIENKKAQRVYFYNDEKMTVHMITNSVSTDTTCRSNATENEYSSLIWSPKPLKNATNNTNSHIVGVSQYVSAVEYFSLGNTTYVIVGKYYDAKNDSHELDCVVFKFNEDRTSMIKIQKIHTNRLWSLKVFYTFQGVNLILGLLGDKDSMHNSEKTLFMRFDPIQEQFFLLREVLAYGCSSAVGLMLEKDSFIALSHKIYPILIFKYDHNVDNYVYQQNLWDELPIRGMSIFYSGGFGISDPHLCVVSDRGAYSIYTYKYVEGWERKFYGQIKGLEYLAPFELNENLYLLALSTNVSYILDVVMFGTE